MLKRVLKIVQYNFIGQLFVNMSFYSYLSQFLIYLKFKRKDKRTKEL